MNKKEAKDSEDAKKLEFANNTFCPMASRICRTDCVCLDSYNQCVSENNYRMNVWCANVALHGVEE